MFASATPATTEFSIDSTTLRDQEFQLQLEKFISQASDSRAYVASNGEWKSSDTE